MADSTTSDPQGNAPPPPLPPERVRDELLEKLHQANQRFSAARQHREEAVDEPTPESTGRDAAAAELRDAEKNVEDVTEEIDRDLHSSS